jgi:hypothetical protein
MTTKAAIESKATEMVRLIISKGVVIDGRVLEEETRLERPREEAERLMAIGHARKPGRYRYAALDNVFIGSRAYDRGTEFFVEEPVPMETVGGRELLAGGKVLPLDLDEPVPDPLPDAEGDDRLWRDGPTVSCLVTESGAAVFRAARPGDTRTLRERLVCDYWFFGQVEITGHLTATGRQYVDQARRTNQRPSYESIARERRRQPVPPDPAGARETLKVRAIRHCNIDGHRHDPGEKFSAPAWLLAQPWVEGQVEPLDRPPVRFLDYCDRIKEFLGNPDAVYPKY